MKSGAPVTPSSAVTPDDSGTTHAPHQRATLDAQPLQIPDHELLKRIGEGSYGEVWLARSAVGTLRAVKIVWRKTFWSDHPFEREFKGIQKFEPISREHEGLVDILQIGRGDGYFYYVMELADSAEVPSAKCQVSGDKRESEGASLRSPDTSHLTPDTYFPLTLDYPLRPSHHPSIHPSIHPSPRLPVAECVRIGLTLASALAHLHKHGLVHRDVKPANVIFVGGTPKLADIGLVTETSEARSYVGTEGFIPPEGPGTPQADLYSLGKLLYEISTGKDRHAFPELPSDLAEQSEAQQLVELNAILLKACQPNPRTRYQSADEMRAELQVLERGQSLKARRNAQRRLAVTKKFAIAAAALALLLTGGWLLVNRFDGSIFRHVNAPAEINSLAVLPFANEGKRSRQEYLSDALADETMRALTNVAGLRVAPRQSAYAFKGTNLEPRQIGEQLGARMVLAGSLEKSTNLLLVAARLIRVADGSNVWSARYDREDQEFGAMGSELVRQVAQRLNLPLGDLALRRLETNLVRKLEAYRLFSRGIKFPRSTRDGINQGMELLNRAIGEDPNFALAYAELATCYWEAGWLFTPKHCATEAGKNASSALDLDDTLALAHSILGWIVWNYDWDFKAAEVRFRRAIELREQNPSRSVAYAYSSFGFFLATLRRFGEADQTLAEGERIAPSTQVMAAVRCWRLHLEHRFEETVHEATRLLARFPNDPVGMERLVYAQQKLGRSKEALVLVERMVQLYPGLDSSAQLGIFQAWAGQREEARKTLEDLRGTGQARPDWAARILAALGEKDQALEQIRIGVEERYLGPIWLVDPLWGDLQSDRRFQALLGKVGLKN